jgi:hypothetical protein
VIRYARLTVLALVSIAMSLGGCASSGTESGGERPARRSNALTQEELLATQRPTLYDALSVLRPNWLADRSPVSFENPRAGQVRVYLEAVDAGGVNYLRQIRVGEVLSVQFLNATEAAQRFGLRTNSGPVILVHTFREAP